MDKFFIKRKKVEDGSVAKSFNSENEPIPSVSAVKAVQGEVEPTGTV